MTRALPPLTARPRDVLLRWQHAGVTVERYDCLPAGPRAVERHCHEEVQLALSSTPMAAYRVRGSTHRVHPRLLSVIASGDVHETFELDAIPDPVTYWITYVTSDALRDVASEVLTRPREPHLQSLLIGEPRALALLRRFQASLSRGTSLERDGALLALMSELVTRWARDHATPRHFAQAPQALRFARDFLRDNVHRNVSLSELAGVGGVSASHLSALFLRDLGMSPHRYQLHVRIEAAKSLLWQGHRISDVAWATGFNHQSHFGRHFKRFVGVAPGGLVPRGSRHRS